MTILILDGQDDLWEPGSTIRWPITEARLLEHPGHADQKVHGRRGGGGDLAGLDAELRSVRGGERLVAMKDGKIVFDKGGAGTSVQLNHADDMALKGTIASHNHPTGWTHPEGTIEHNGNGPSQPDLETAWRAGVQEMRIVTPGSVYSVKQGTDTTWGGASDARQKRLEAGPDPLTGLTEDVSGRSYSPAEREMNRSLQSISNVVQSDFMHDISVGKKTIGQAQMLHYDEVLRRAGAEHGWEVSITHNSDYVPISGPSVYDPEPPSGQTFDQRFGSMFPPLPGMGQQSQVGESLERRVARELIRHTIRLLEHPGHADQKVHGHRGIGATQRTSDLSPKVQGAIDKTAARMGLDSPEAMADRMDRIYDSASPRAMEQGMAWYGDLHDSTSALAEQYGLTPEQTAATMAVYSPARDWAANARVGEATIHIVGKNERFTVHPPGGEPRDSPVAPGSYLPSQLSAKQLVYNHPTLSMDASMKGAPDHYRQAEKAVSLLRGDITPDMALTGPKTRNFNNNILNPNDPRYVTVDAWMYQAALGPSAKVTIGTGDRATTQSVSDWGYSDFGSKMGSSPSVASEGYKAGMYPHFAEAIQVGAARHGISPNQYQAVVWEAARESGLQD